MTASSSDVLELAHLSVGLFFDVGGGADFMVSESVCGLVNTGILLKML